MFLNIFFKKNYEYCVIGGAVAIDLAARVEYSQKIWCVIVENTFTSIPDMATVLMSSELLKYVPLFLYKNKVTLLKQEYIYKLNKSFNFFFTTVYVQLEDGQNAGSHIISFR